MTEDRQFSPSEHTVQETQDYLADADATEVERVKAEEARAGNRKGIVEWQPAASDAKPDEDGYTRVPVKSPYPAAPVLERDEDEDTDTEV